MEKMYFALYLKMFYAFALKKGWSQAPYCRNGSIKNADRYG
jgi:hypothetical protein